MTHWEDFLETRTDHSAVDYNSWVESAKGRKLSSKLDRDIVLAEGMAVPVPESCV